MPVQECDHSLKEGAIKCDRQLCLSCSLCNALQSVMGFHMSPVNADHLSNFLFFFYFGMMDTFQKKAGYGKRLFVLKVCAVLQAAPLICTLIELFRLSSLFLAPLLHLLCRPHYPCKVCIIIVHASVGLGEEERQTDRKIERDRDRN